jgi:hypothetical protein
LNRIEVQPTRTTSLRFALRHILATYLRCPHRTCYCLPTSPDFVLAPFVLEQKAATCWSLVQANNRRSTTQRRVCLLLSLGGFARCCPNNSCCRSVSPCDNWVPTLNKFRPSQGRGWETWYHDRMQGRRTCRCHVVYGLYHWEQVTGGHLVGVPGLV